MNIKNSLIEVVFQCPYLSKSPRLILKIDKSNLEYTKVIKTNISLLNVYNDVLKVHINQNEEIKSRDDYPYKEINAKFQVRLSFLFK